MAEVLQFPFAHGIDEGSDPKALTPGTPLVMLNRFLDKAGRSHKRYGVRTKTAAILGGGSISVGKRLITRGDDLALFDGATLYGFSETLGSWQALDRPSPLTVTKRALTDSSLSVNSLDVASYGNLLIALYLTSGTGAIFFEVRDLENKAVVVPQTLLSTTAASSPRVLVYGTNAYFLFAAAGSIQCATFDLTTMTLSTPVGSLVTDSRTSPSVLDAVIGVPTATGVPTLYVLYELQTGALRAKIASFTLAYAAIASNTRSGTSMRAACLSFNTTAQTVTAAFAAGSLSLVTFDTGLATATVSTAPYGGIADWVFVTEYDSTNLLVGWTRNDGSGTDADRLTTALYSKAAHAQVTLSERITFGLYYPSKPWQAGGRWYTAALTFVHPYSVTTTDPLAQVSSVIVEIETTGTLSSTVDSTHPHVATLANQTGWFGGSQVKVAIDTAGAVYVPATHRNLEPANYAATPIPYGWDLYKVELGTGDIGRCAALVNGALCSGAAPFWFDGSTAFPYGFAHAPQIISVGISNNGGVLVAGTYGYVAVYTRPDANGVLHRSVPSFPKTATTSGVNLTVDVKVATASLSGRQRALTVAKNPNPVQIILHRTIANGPDYYRLTLEPTHNVLTNDARVGDVTLRDTKADSNIASGTPAVTLASRAALYTAEELEDVPPPASLTVMAHNRRLWLIASDGHTLWATKDASENPDVAPGFNEELTLYFVREKTALGALDELVVVLGPDSIDFVAGLGPDSEGTGVWSQSSMQTDVGCIEPRSVVAIPQGVVFQSRRSLELLTRERTLSWFGQPVQDTLNAFPTITSAVVVASQHQVRFTCNTADLTDGVVLVFDYVRGAWSTFDYGFAAADACMVGGVYTLLRYTGAVLQEDTTTHLDDGAYVPAAVELPLSPSGPGAWQRVKACQVLGTSVTDHDMTIRMRRDFAAAFEQNKSFLAGSNVTAVGPLENARITFARQKGQGFSVRIEDAAPTSGTLGTGAGPILEGLSLYVQRKEGLPKLSAGRRG